MKHRTLMTVAAFTLLTATPLLAQVSGGTGMGSGTAASSGAAGGSGSTGGVGSAAGTTSTSTTNGNVPSYPASGTATNVGTASPVNDVTWNAQNTYWRNSYPTRPYYNSARNYATYEPAYRYGVELYNQNPNTPYTSLNATQLSAGWTQVRGSSALTWSDAEAATRDSYNRLYDNRNAPGSNPATR